jgi:Holliday junction resolvase RusA-like endonuclease
MDPQETAALLDEREKWAIFLRIPMPPSVNAATRVGRSKSTGKSVVFSSPEKRKFFAEADAYFLQQKSSLMGQKIDGPFQYHLTLNEALRHGNSDGDNRGKYALDYLQRVGLIKNDKYAQGGSWKWGPCDAPAIIAVGPYEVESHRVSSTKETAEG